MVSRRKFLQAMITAGLGADALHGNYLHAQAGVPSQGEYFTVVPSSSSKITWQHTSGRSPEMYLPETAGPGCAFLDYDNDGWMDIYLVNSGPCDFYQPAAPLRNALYRNNRNGTFTDVTVRAGVAGGAYGMGVAAADYDGDGFTDLYVTQYDRSILYHNNRDGTFSDVTQSAGVAAPGWSTSAVWFDYDGDGRLDLFVCRFVDFSKAKNKFCGDPQTGERFYCVPSAYDPMPNYLFHNNGDGTFKDVSREAGIGEKLGKAWGVVATDINNDRRMDLFVSNDTVPNFLFANRGKGIFEEIGLPSDVAYSAAGLPRSGMGVDSTDYDQDGWMDLFVANIDQQMFSLYHNNHDGTFDDETLTTGIGTATRLLSGWGLKFFDFDNDGNLDLMLCNGHPDNKVHQYSMDVTYREPMLLFQNTGRGFRNISDIAGPIFSKRLAGRGLAIGDFNNDGAVDVLVGINNGAPILLKNNAGPRNHWLGIWLVGKECNRDAIGARITYRAGQLKRSVSKVGGGSYLSSHDPRIVLGLGDHACVDAIEVHWPLPSNKIDRFTNVSADRYLTIVEGQGIK